MHKQWQHLLKDRIFIGSLLLYLMNRLLTYVFGFSNTLLSSYFNDFLLVPCCVPLLLFLIERCGFRKVYVPPRLIEVVIPLVIWSIAFEIVGPLYFKKGVSDFFDILAYWIGGALSWYLWNRKFLRYGGQPRRLHPIGQGT